MPTGICQGKWFFVAIKYEWYSFNLDATNSKLNV